MQKIREDLKNIQQTAEEQIDVICDFSFAEFEKRYLINNPLFIQLKGLREEIQKQLEYKTEFDYTPYLKRFKVLGEPLADVGTIKYTFCNYIKNSSPRDE